jgi:DNA-binding transcriptional regulator YhcF (GntR family)
LASAYLYWIKRAPTVLEHPMTLATATRADDLLYERVSSHIISLIDHGTLRPGDRIPSVRKLSRQLEVSISTVLQAYRQL